MRLLLLVIIIIILAVDPCHSAKWLNKLLGRIPPPPPAPPPRPPGPPPSPPESPKLEIEWYEPSRVLPPIGQSLWSVKVFIHVHAIDHYAEILRQQMMFMHFSGLYERCDAIHVFIGGPDPTEVGHAALLPTYYGDKYVVHTKYNDTHKLEERLTLENIFPLINTTDKILYMHSKGVTHGKWQKSITQWRMFLEYFNIRFWRVCLCLLDKYDTVGAGYNPMLNEYAGNFWWTTGKYYLTLPRTIMNGEGYAAHDAPEDFLLHFTNNTKVFNFADHLGVYYTDTRMPPHMWDKLWTTDRRYLDASDECFHLASCS